MEIPGTSLTGRQVCQNKEATKSIHPLLRSSYILVVIKKEVTVMFFTTTAITHSYLEYTPALITFNKTP